MKCRIRLLTATLVFAVAGLAQTGNEVESPITQLDAGNRTLTVQGIVIHTDACTDYDHGLHGFENLREDQWVEVRSIDCGGCHIATEIELDS